MSEGTDKSLLNAVLEDVDFKKAAPEQYARLAAGLLVAFTKSFIDGKHAACEIYRFEFEKDLYINFSQNCKRQDDVSSFQRGTE